MFARLAGKLSAHAPLWLVRTIGNLYAPFLGAGIKVTTISPDSLHMRVEMPLRWYNRNYVGTHYGGSIFSMTDPFYMTMLINALGPGYVVWDRSASIEFKRPGRTRLRAEFFLDPEEVKTVRHEVDKKGRASVEKSVDVRDDDGKLVARVRKSIYIRKG